MNMQICPVCLAQIEPNDAGCVLRHLTVVGQICPMSGKEFPRWTERATRAAVVGRSNGICEWCAYQRATDMHHRKSRGVGGMWHPANIVHLCRVCHAWATVNREMAEQLGLVVESYRDPAIIPITRPDGTQLTLNDLVAPPRVAM